MAIICTKHNLLFIMTPRTACTAIGKVLCEQFNGEFIPQEDVLDSKGLIMLQKKHNTITELLQNNLLSTEDVSSLIKFCSVRNPFDSLLSLYLKKRYKYQPLLSDPSSWVNRTPYYKEDMKFCKNHSFQSWIIKTCYKKAIKRSIGFKPSMFDEYTKGVDIIMRYENIEKDFNEVLIKAGISFQISIPMVNRTTERANADYRPYYSSLARKLVEYTFYYDFKTYGYKF